MSHFDLEIVLEKMLNSTFRLLPRKVCSLTASSGTNGWKWFWRSSQSLTCTLDSGINVGVRLLIFGLFSNGYVLIKGGTIINFFYFLDIFFACFTLAIYKKINLSVISRGSYAYSMGYVYCFCKKFQGLHLFKGVRLFRSLE